MTEPAPDIAEIHALLSDLLPETQTAAGRLRDGAADRAITQAMRRYEQDCPTLGVAPSAVIPNADRQAVASLAASFLLDQLAVATAGDGDPTIASDSTDHRGASDRYAARARAARAAYEERISRHPRGAAHITLPEPSRRLLRGLT